ncbi:MAG: hypothetical protein Q9223_004516 [Gallowayella weberi]
MSTPDEDVLSVVRFTIPSTKSTFKEDKCNICLRTFSESGEEAIELPCGHIFGMTCINDWRTGKKQPGCPLCRLPYTTTVKEMQIENNVKHRKIKETKTLKDLGEAVEEYFVMVEKHENWVRPVLASQKMMLARGDKVLASDVDSLYKQVDALDQLLETEWYNVEELGKRLRMTFAIFK